MRNVRYNNRCAGTWLNDSACNRCRSDCTEAAEVRIVGTKTRTITQGRDMNAYCDMKERLMSLYFVMTELELFLDVHPDNSAAIARYKCAVKEYEELASVFEAKYGPLLVRNGNCANEWLWVREPWPWEV